MLSGCVSELKIPIKKTDKKFVTTRGCIIKSDISGTDYSISGYKYYYLSYLDTDSSKYDVRVFLTENSDYAYEVDENNNFLNKVYFKGLRWYHKTNIESDCKVEFVTEESVIQKMDNATLCIN